MNFARKFFSLKSKAPQQNDTTTEERLTIETTDIIASSLLSATKYAKTAAYNKIEIKGIAQVNRNFRAARPCTQAIIATARPIITI